MHKAATILLISVTTILCSCKNEVKYTYAIKDFRKSLQPFLKNVVFNGCVTFHDSTIIKTITDKELILLTRSEHPILRATALEEMLYRNRDNNYEIVLNHLDDTAIVAVDNGEFGMSLDRVSDYLISRAEWSTREEKNLTIDKVLTQHNYLSSAYKILTQFEPKEKYYPFVKDMATRPRLLDRYEGYELRFSEIEYALYGLARYRKQEDISMISTKLMRNVCDLSLISFRLIKELPDTAYMNILETFYRRSFYKYTGNGPGGFTGIPMDKSTPEDFINALIAQKNERSASLLDTVLTHLLRNVNIPNKVSVLDNLIEEIWDNPCPAYARLREKIRVKAENIKNNRVKLSPIEPDYSFKPEKEVFRW